MKKLPLVMVVVMLIGTPTASASGSVKYTKQKAGQFCKNLDRGKSVATPSGTLKCIVANGSPRARWTH